jgi:hypothetical protein
MYIFLRQAYSLVQDKSKPAKRQGRKATGPRFLRDAFDDATKDPKIAGLLLFRTQRMLRVLCRRVQMRKLSVLAAIPLLFTGAQAQLTGSLGIAENACVLPIATFLFQNCGYSGGANISADLGGGNVWIGPLNLGGFYSSIAAAPGFTLSTQTGFDDNGVPLTSFLIGLQSSPGDGKVAPTMTSNISVVGSVVSGSFTIGAGAHLVSTGPALAGIKQAIEIWTSITHVLTAKLADNVIPGNAFGGSDYIIGSTGFPPTLCTATDCFAS